jgi:GNAT superfamily N-acetyltransferase
MHAVTITRAREPEVPAALALLPEARQMPAELLLARIGGRLAGAAAVMWRSWASPGGFPIQVQVVPDLRRQGVGRRLVEAAIDLAQGESPGLWSLEPEAVDGPAASFLQACGFTIRRRQQNFQATGQALRENVTPLLRRMAARGRVPADARVVPLAEAPLDAVSWLVSAEFGGGPFRALQNLAGRIAERGVSTEDISQVVLQGGEVAAVLLARMDHGVAVIDARVVAPAARGGWAGALQLDEILHLGLKRGIAEFRFQCDDDVSDTLAIARRSGARELGQKAFFYYALSAS